jgi:hypothetical protein
MGPKAIRTTLNRARTLQEAQERAADASQAMQLPIKGRGGAK